MQERKTNRNQNGGGGGGGGGGVAGNHNGGSAADPLTAQANIILRFEEELKAAIFNVMYILLKESDISFWKYALIITIDFLQMLQFTFDSSMESAWKGDGVFYYVSNFLNFTHIVPWMDQLDLVSYLVIFYLCVFVITCAILAFIYVSLTSKRLKNSFIWPQQMLRQSFYLIPTVLFIPFLGKSATLFEIKFYLKGSSFIYHVPNIELFTSMLVCVPQSNQQQLLSSISSSSGNRQVHLIYQDFQCWTGIHIIHSTFAIAASLVLILLSLLITLTFYKTLQSSTDASAKSDSGPDVQRLIQKIVICYAFSFLNEEKQQWFLITISVIFAGITLERFFSLRSYYNEDIQRFHCVLRGLGLWSTAILFLSKLLQNTDFNGGLQIWLLGIPLVIGIIVFNRDNRKSDMLLNMSSFQQGEQVARQIRYFLQVLTRRDNGDRNAEIILKGYIYSHEDQCPNNQCQLKQYKRNIILFTQNKTKRGKAGYNGSTMMSNHIMMSQKMDNNQLLIQHAKNMFRMGIQKFPGSAALRIQYAFFLIEKMNKKQEAVVELNSALILQPTFDEQFIIFRHKKLSEEYSEETSQMVGQNAGIQGQGNANDKNNQQGNQNAVDIMTRFAFESTFRQLQTQIERCTQFHMEFWNYLKDDRPDLGKLGDCGARINQSIMNVEMIWMELQKLNQNVPKAMKLYGRFLTEILHDREQGQEYLQRAKDVANMKQNYVIGSFDDVSNIMQVSSDGTPCIIVSGEPEKLSIITQCNSGAVRVFGFQQFELKNQRVEKLMPEVYARHHPKILEEALQKGPENIVNKERLIFAKHKSGYIFPVWIQLKLIQNIQNEIQFIALFKIDKKMMNANIGFILFNKEKKIQGISSSCLKIMGLDINMVRRMTAANYDINRLSPDLEDQREELAQSKSGMVIEWVIPFFSRKKWPIKLDGMERLTTGKKKELEEKDKPNLKIIAQQQSHKKDQTTVAKKRFKFLCTLTPITMGSLSEIGHFIRLEAAKNDSARYFQQQQQQQSQIPKQSAQTKAKDSIKQPLFQFRFDFYTGRFIREIRDSLIPYSNKNPFFTDEEFFKQSTEESQRKNTGPTGNPRKTFQDIENAGMIGERSKDADDNKKEQLIPTADAASAMAISGLGPLGDIIQEDLQLKKKRWGKGIQIYTLREGRVQLKDYIDEEKRLLELEEMKRRRQEEDERNKQELANFTNNIKSKKALRLALNDQAVPNAIKNLRFTMNIVIIFLLALAISEFTVISQQFQEINENFGMIQRSYLRVSEVQRVAYDIRTIILINEGQLSSYKEYTIPSIDLIEYLKNDLELALNSLYELQDYISLSQLSLSSQHQDMVDQKIVPMYFKESVSGSKVINFTLTESVLQMSSAIFTVRHLETNKFNENQEDIYFVMFNSFNGFLNAMLKSSEYYEEELYDRSSQKNNLLLILFLSSLGTVCLSLPILFPAVNSVNKTKEKVLALFIEIPNGYLAELCTRCETFLNSFYDDQQDESKSQDDNSTHGGLDFIASQDSGGGVTKRNVIKQARNTSNTSRNFFLQFSFAVMLIIAYFTSMFIIAKNYINSIEIVTKEMSVASFNEAHFSFILNTQREMIYNPNKVIFSSNSFNVSRDILLQIYGKVQLYLDLHQENRNVLNQDYKDIFEEIMNHDLCKSSYIQKSLLPLPCETLFNDAPTHGLQSVVINYFEQLRETLNIYKNLTMPQQKINATSNSSTKIVGPQKRELWELNFEKCDQVRQLQTSITPNRTSTTNTTSSSNSSKTNSTSSVVNSTKSNTTTQTSSGSNQTSTVNQSKTNSTTQTSNNSSSTSQQNTTKTNTSSNSNSSPQNISTAPSTLTTPSSSSTKRNITLSNFLNQVEFKTLYWLQFRFLQDAFRILVSTLNSSTNSDFETTINTKMAVFIVFVIIVCLSYLIFWTPFVSKLNRDIQRTKLMLTIVPIPIIMKIPKIQEYLNKQAAASGTTAPGSGLVSGGGLPDESTGTANGSGGQGSQSKSGKAAGEGRQGGRRK